MPQFGRSGRSAVASGPCRVESVIFGLLDGGFQDAPSLGERTDRRMLLGPTPESALIAVVPAWRGHDGSGAFGGDQVAQHRVGEQHDRRDAAQGVGVPAG